MSIKFFNLNNVPLHELNIPIRNMYGHAETRTSGPLGAIHKWRQFNGNIYELSITTFLHECIWQVKSVGKKNPNLNVN